MKRGRHVRPAKSLIYKVAMTLVVVFCLLLFAGQFGVMGLRSLSVQSGSMEPSIRQNSIVFTAPVSAPQVGDVVTFERPGQPEILITHRIVDVRREAGATLYTTKGDANEGVDGEAVPAANVVGRVWFVVPLLGGVVNAARTDVGFMALIVIPATIIVHNEILSLRQDLADRRARRRALAA